MSTTVDLPPDAAGDLRRRRADRALQVADVLRRQVLYGLFPTGVLPSEPSLVDEFGVSRNTVREALGLLRAEGLVERCPGVGTVVCAQKYHHGLDRLQGLAETLHEHGRVVNEVRTRGLVAAPGAVAARLLIPPGEQVVYLERLRMLDGLPLSLDLTYLVRDLGEPILERDLVGQDIFVLLAQVAGQRLGQADLAIEAVAADAHSAATLQTPRGTALLMIERMTRLADGRPVDLEFIRFRGDRITMRGTTRRTATEEDPAS
ncbi:MAG: GntR family transcriptional regulator [Nocardioidaceae bacterium]